MLSMLSNRYVKPIVLGCVGALTVVMAAAPLTDGAETEAVGEQEKTTKLNPRIEALPDNSWLKMNPEREPAGRNYSGCCLGDWGEGPRIWYFGGGHVSYEYDDIEFYDMSTNTWRRTWEPGGKERRATFKKEDTARDLERMHEQIKAGRPQATHTYQQVCWVPDRKVFSMVSWAGGHWEFDPVKNSWTCIYLPPRAEWRKDGEPEKPVPWTRYAAQTHHLFYSPEIKDLVAVTTHSPSGDWVYDHEKTAWKMIPGHPKNLGGELYSAYVPELGGQVISRFHKDGGWFLRKGTREKSEWTKLEGVPDDAQGCRNVGYDSLNKVVLAAFPNGEKSGRLNAIRLWAMDVKTMKWTELKPEGAVPAGSASGGSFASLWYEPAHNAFFFLNRTGQTQCETWVYRYKRAAEGK